jgi:hypothetical protein
MDARVVMPLFRSLWTDISSLAPSGLNRLAVCFTSHARLGKPTIDWSTSVGEIGVHAVLAHSWKFVEEAVDSSRTPCATEPGSPRFWATLVLFPGESSGSDMPQCCVDVGSVKV